MIGALAGAAVLIAFGAGSAYAGSKWLITSTSQIKPTVLKQLKGKTGKTGPRGATGSRGAIDATGAPRTTGQAGSTDPGLSTLLAPEMLTRPVD